MILMDEMTDGGFQIILYYKLYTDAGCWLESYLNPQGWHALCMYFRVVYAKM